MAERKFDCVVEIHTTITLHSSVIVDKSKMNKSRAFSLKALGVEELVRQAVHEKLLDLDLKEAINGKVKVGLIEKQYTRVKGTISLKST